MLLNKITTNLYGHAPWGNIVVGFLLRNNHRISDSCVTNVGVLRMELPLGI